MHLRKLSRSSSYHYICIPLLLLSLPLLLLLAPGSTAAAAAAAKKLLHNHTKTHKLTKIRRALPPQNKTTDNTSVWICQNCFGATICPGLHHMDRIGVKLNTKNGTLLFFPNKNGIRQEPSLLRSAVERKRFYGSHNTLNKKKLTNPNKTCPPKYPKASYRDTRVSFWYEQEYTRNRACFFFSQAEKYFGKNHRRCRELMLPPLPQIVSRDKMAASALRPAETNRKRKQNR